MSPRRGGPRRAAWKPAADELLAGTAFLAAFGKAAVAGLPRIRDAGRFEIEESDAPTPFRVHRLDSPRPGLLFASPSGRCRGLLAGQIFEPELPGAEPDAQIEPDARLGLELERLYGRHGPELGAALDGIYALVALVDDRLLLVRDAIGEHPLYVLETSEGIVASDRLAPLLRHPLCGRRLDAGAITDYLTTAFCPFARTPIEGIRKLLPGEAWEIGPRAEGADWELQRAHYHRLAPAGSCRDSPQHGDEERVGELRRLLEGAVDRRFPGSPVALLLSGGLDSSLVGGLLGHDRLEAAYSLSFGDRHRNELEFSSLVARHLRIPHRVVTVSPRQIRDAFPRTLGVLDEPIGDPLTVPNLLVAETVAGGDASTLFNGEGGDPLFGGPKNLPMLAAEAYAPAAAAGEREERYLASYNKGYPACLAVLAPDFAARAAAETSTAELLAPYLNEPAFPSLLDRLMYVNLRLKGAAQILPKVFKASTAAGLVAQSPLFDRRLAEAAFRLPPAAKLRGSVEKWALKRAVGDLLPQSIVDRPKSGMLVPVRHWFRRELRSFSHDLLLSRRARERGLLRTETVRRLLRRRGGGPGDPFGDRIWLLLSLEVWLEEHGL